MDSRLEYRFPYFEENVSEELGQSIKKSLLLVYFLWSRTKNTDASLVNSEVLCIHI